MSTIEELQERGLENEMYEQGFWQRPVQPVPRLPETEAVGADWFQEHTGFVHVRFSYTCGVCKVQSEGVDRIPNATPKQFARNVICRDD